MSKSPKQRAWQSLPATMRTDLPAVLDLLRASDMLGDTDRLELWRDGRQLYGPVVEGETVLVFDGERLRRES